MKFFFKLLMTSFLFFCIERFCHRQTKGFEIAKIHSPFAANPKWELPPLSEEEKKKIETLLAAPFTFLGSGGQCYAFLSQDKKTVLKLYKMHHLYSFSWMEELPFFPFFKPLRKRIILHQKEKRDHLFDSSHLAWTALKEETGLIHLQLNPKGDSPFSVTIIDNLKIAHRIQLDTIPFALQAYAENPFKQLRAYLSRQDVESAKCVVKDISDCLIARYKKQIADSDPALRRNIGLLNNRAIFIDIGSFFSPKTQPVKRGVDEELYSETRRMDRWLQKRSPILKAYLDEQIANAKDLERGLPPL